MLHVAHVKVLFLCPLGDKGIGVRLNVRKDAGGLGGLGDMPDAAGSGSV
jgi:hypothetical protein